MADDIAALLIASPWTAELEGYAMFRYSASLEDIKVRVRSVETLDTQPVHIAIVSAGAAPESLDWVEATWLGATGVARSCSVLVGPSGGLTAFLPGNYDILVRVTGDVERPVVLAGQLTFI